MMVYTGNQPPEQFNGDLLKEVAGLLAGGPTGFATDLDGTLSPIALTPEEACVTRGSREALERVYKSGLFKVMAVITGRTSLEARKMVGLGKLTYVGNHGLELLLPGSDEAVLVKAARPFRPLISSVLETLRHNLKQKSASLFGSPDFFETLIFEYKGLTASIHYRLCPDPELARAAILEQLAGIGASAGLRIAEGRMVVEIRPPVEVNKGTALAELVEDYGLGGLLYLGDDLTDVDGFKALRQLEKIYRAGNNPSKGAPHSFRGLAIGVRSAEMNPAVATYSDYLLDGVPGVEQFLASLGRLPAIIPTRK